MCGVNGGRYPVILNSFGLRRGSGGDGARRGGDGVSREMTFRKNLTVSVLSERRAFRPWGLAGGLPAETGVRVLPQLLQYVPGSCLVLFLPLLAPLELVALT